VTFRVEMEESGKANGSLAKVAIVRLSSAFSANARRMAMSSSGIFITLKIEGVILSGFGQIGTVHSTAFCTAETTFLGSDTVVYSMLRARL
jgi:hypothetical protein